MTEDEKAEARRAAQHAWLLMGLGTTEQEQVDEIYRAIVAERERWEDKVDGLTADLDSAVEVAWKRGATEWVRLNYPAHYTRFTGNG